MAFELRSIIAPTDFSEPSTHALQIAVDLAKLTGAEIHLVHAYQVPIYAMPDGAVLARPEYLQEITDEVARQLDHATSKHNGSGVKMRSHVVMGTPFQEINRVAKEVGAGLIVMGTHGRSGLTHFLLGSVTERVVRTSTVPVLTVPPAKR